MFCLEVSKPTNFMGGSQMKIKNKKKGFTLIELLIVVAIIAILAAIAIPQFSAYRIKGYNAAASSDIRNGKTAEEALFADFQGYGTSSTAAGTVNGTTGVPVPSSPAWISFTDIDAGTTVREVNTALSNGVSLWANTNAAAAGSRPANYTIATKHLQGDRVFAGDSNDTILRWKAGTPGNAVVTTDCPASTAAGDITTTGYTAL
jgi:prepilin-type N-terminal cleavage/methylation domain-containing protein